MLWHHIKTGLTCGKNASHCLDLKQKKFGFCRTHLSQADEYWCKKDTENYFVLVNDDQKVVICIIMAIYVIQEQISLQ